MASMAVMRKFRRALLYFHLGKLLEFGDIPPILYQPPQKAHNSLRHGTTWLRRCLKKTLRAPESHGVQRRATEVYKEVHEEYDPPRNAAMTSTVVS